MGLIIKSVVALVAGLATGEYTGFDFAGYLAVLGGFLMPSVMPVTKYSTMIDWRYLGKYNEIEFFECTNSLAFKNQLFMMTDCVMVLDSSYIDTNSKNLQELSTNLGSFTGDAKPKKVIILSTNKINK